MSYQPTRTISGSIGLHCAAGVGTMVHPELWPWAAGGIAANHAFLGALGMWPRSTWLGPNITWLGRESAARGEVALTFDDGPDAAITPALMDLLEARGARATFFCIAERATRQRDLCREMVRRGHGLENHSSRDARTFALHGLGGFRREIASAQAALLAASGREPRFFRAPAGLRNPLLDPVLQELGLRLVSWTRRAFDTRERDAVAVAERLVARLAAGDVLLMHDGDSARAASGTAVVLEALPRILDAAAARGLRCVSLQQALSV